MMPPEWQNFISTYQIGGFFPLDKLLHIFVGVVITLTGRRLGWSVTRTALLLGIIAVGKEANDFFVLTSTWQEHLLDIGATFLYPALVWPIAYLQREEINRSRGHSPR